MILSKDVRRIGSGMMAEMARALMDAQGLKREDVRYWVLHSAGRRVLDRVRALARPRRGARSPTRAPSCASTATCPRPPSCSCSSATLRRERRAGRVGRDGRAGPGLRRRGRAAALVMDRSMTTGRVAGARPRATATGRWRRPPWRVDSGRHRPAQRVVRRLRADPAPASAAPARRAAARPAARRRGRRRRPRRLRASPSYAGRAARGRPRARHRRRPRRRHAGARAAAHRRLSRDLPSCRPTPPRCRFRDGGVDVAVAALTLHHLDPRRRCRGCLAEMRRPRASRVVVNDLLRTRARAGAGLARDARCFACIRCPAHDGPLSVRRAYSPDELRGLACEGRRSRADDPPLPVSGPAGRRDRVSGRRADVVVVGAGPGGRRRRHPARRARTRRRRARARRAAAAAHRVRRVPEPRGRPRCSTASACSRRWTRRAPPRWPACASPRRTAPPSSVAIARSAAGGPTATPSACRARRSTGCWPSGCGARPSTCASGRGWWTCTSRRAAWWACGPRARTALRSTCARAW